MEFEIGDIIKAKDYPSLWMIMEKEPRDSHWGYCYVARDLTTEEEYGIYISINNKVYKKVA